MSGKKEEETPQVGDVGLRSYEIREREVELSITHYDVAQLAHHKNTNKTFHQVFTFIAQTSRNKQQHTTLTCELLVFLDELFKGHGVLLSNGQIVQHALHLGGELRATLALQLCVQKRDEGW